MSGQRMVAYFFVSVVLQHLSALYVSTAYPGAFSQMPLGLQKILTIAAISVAFYVISCIKELMAIVRDRNHTVSQSFIHSMFWVTVLNTTFIIVPLWYVTQVPELIADMVLNGIPALGRGIASYVAAFITLVISLATTTVVVNIFYGVLGNLVTDAVKFLYARLQRRLVITETSSTVAQQGGQPERR